MREGEGVRGCSPVFLVFPILLISVFLLFILLVPIFVSFSNSCQITSGATPPPHSMQHISHADFYH